MARKKIRLATEQRPFIMVYKDFLESKFLDNYYQKLVYIYLKKFTDSKNKCYPSVKTISKQSGISINKVKSTLKELEEKGVFVKENRSRSDGGKSSNLYTLYDYRELWCSSSSDETEVINDELEDRRMIEALESRGYVVIKEKEPESAAPVKVTAETDTQKINQVDRIDFTTDSKKSQSLERYTLDEIKQLYDYEIMTYDNPLLQDNIDSVMEILHTAMNSTKPKIRISGEEKPTMVVIGKLMKLNKESIVYAIEKFQEQTERIKNPTSYMLTILYNAPEQYRLDIENRVAHDMANFSKEL